MTKVEWVSWTVKGDAPDEPGNYLTYWSDGYIETFYLDEEDLEKSSITAGNSTLLYWADNVEPPDLSGN